MKLRWEDLVWQCIDGRMILLDLQRNASLAANATAAFLIRQLETERTPGELVAALRQEYGISELRARQDVEAFLASMRDKRLLA